MPMPCHAAIPAATAKLCHTKSISVSTLVSDKRARQRLRSSGCCRGPIRKCNGDQHSIHGQLLHHFPAPDQRSTRPTGNCTAASTLERSCRGGQEARGGKRGRPLHSSVEDCTCIHFILLLMRAHASTVPAQCMHSFHAHHANRGALLL